MHDLTPITPLGLSEPIVETYGPVTLSEVTDTALASVASRHGRGAETLADLERFLGDVPPAPGYLGGKSFTAFWIGPDQWMIEAPIDSNEDLAAQLAARANGIMSVTEQTDGWCRFDLTGEQLPEVFERVCPANTRAFAGGEAVRTTIHHLNCFVLCRKPGYISVIGPRSSAGSLHHALKTAMLSVF